MIAFAVAPLSALSSGDATPDDRFYADRFRTDRRRRQSIAARILLRRVLAKYARRPAITWTLERDPLGRMRARHDGLVLAASLCHSGGVVACAATTRTSVGVDIEDHGRARDAGALGAIFGPNEQKIVHHEGPEAFYRIWTLREAMAKASGLGFASLVDGKDQFAPPPPGMFCFSVRLDRHTLSVVAPAGKPGGARLETTTEHDITYWSSESADYGTITRAASPLPH